MEDTFTRYLKSQHDMVNTFQQLIFNCKELMAQMKPIITNKQEEKFVSSVIPKIMLITNKFKDISLDLNSISASAHVVSYRINNTEKGTEKATEKVTEKESEKATEKVTEKATEKGSEKSSEKVSEKGSEKVTQKSNVAPPNFPKLPILNFPKLPVLRITVPPVTPIPLKLIIDPITKNLISIPASTKTTTVPESGTKVNYKTPIEYVTHLQMNKLFVGLYVETDISSDEGIIKGYIKEITRKHSTIKIKMLNGKFIIVKYNEQWRIYDPNKMKESNKRSLEFDESNESNESTERPKKIRKVRDCSEDDSGIIMAELIDTI